VKRLSPDSILSTIALLVGSGWLSLAILAAALLVKPVSQNTPPPPTVPAAPRDTSTHPPSPTASETPKPLNPIFQTATELAAQEDSPTPTPEPTPTGEILVITQWRVIAPQGVNVRMFPVPTSIVWGSLPQGAVIWVALMLSEYSNGYTWFYIVTGEFADSWVCNSYKGTVYLEEIK